VTDTERTRILNVLRNVHNLNVTCLGVTLFLMDSGELKLKKLWGNRFNNNIFLFRVGGIPFKTRKLFIMYTIYRTTITISSYTTFLEMFADMYVHWGDLVCKMTNTCMCVLIPLKDAL
jgi:hypothetical protein